MSRPVCRCIFSDVAENPLNESFVRNAELIFAETLVTDRNRACREFWDHAKAAKQSKVRCPTFIHSSKLKKNVYKPFKK
jgi:hypothetical protein